MNQQLPLFPLGTVLFPGGTLNLHIFEDRYRQMIGRCLDQHSPFGVVLIREGDEVIEGRTVARPVAPYTIGTVAQISANVRLEDGRYLLTATGQQRFRIKAITQPAPYLIATVDLLTDAEDPAAEPIAAELRAAYERYWQAMHLATGVPLEAEELSGNPMEMSYQLADRIQIEPARKQQWLEADVASRLAAIAAELRAELALLPAAGKRKANDSWSGLGSLN